MTEACIYGLSLDGVHIRYVGLTRMGVFRRFREHQRAALGGINFPVYHWMRKHGVENVRVDVITGCRPEDVSDLEVYWISELKEQGHHLLNVQSGGSGYVIPTETRKRKPLTPEHKAKISEAARRRKASPESRAKMSAARKGKPISEEAKAKMSAAMRGRKKSEEEIQRRQATVRARRQNLVD